MLSAAREFLERELALCTQGTSRAEERIIAERVCEVIEMQDFEEYDRLLVVAIVVANPPRLRRPKTL